MRSMTGFGRFQQDDGAVVQTWEIRSVNSRFLDLKWKLPPQARKVVRQAAEAPACRREEFGREAVIYSPEHFQRCLGVLLQGRARVTEMTPKTCLQAA